MNNPEKKNDIEIFEELDREHKLSIEKAKIKEIATQIATNLASLLLNQQDYHRSINTRDCINFAGQIYRGIVKQDE
jgi:hypothetical protein